MPLITTPRARSELAGRLSRGHCYRAEHNGTYVISHVTRISARVSPPLVLADHG